MQIKFKFKEFEIVLWKMRYFRLCRDSNPGLSIAGGKRLFFRSKISNSLNLNLKTA